MGTTHDLEMDEAVEQGLPLAQIMADLTEDQHAALCQGQPVITESGTLFPLVTKLPGATEPMVTVVLSHMTQRIIDEWRSKNDRFKENMADLLHATALAAPEAMPAIKELLESYRDYDDATSNVVDTVLGDYSNMLASFSMLPAITIRAERGAAANKRHEASAAGKAKKAANSLWAEAHRNGWTADRMYLELTRRGHKVSTGRVAKWMTNLRRTGRC